MTNIALPLQIVFRKLDSFWRLDLNTSAAIEMRCCSENENRRAEKSI